MKTLYIFVTIYILYTMISVVDGFLSIRKLKTVERSLQWFGKIPNIIFRTTETLITNLHMYECNKQWEILNPNYSIVWYNNDNRRRFMKKYFPKILETYDKLKPGAFKCDLWRLCILYKFGGVYIDSEAIIYSPIKQIANCGFVAVLDCKQAGSGIHNGFIISERKHPFLKQAIFDIVENVKNKYYGNGPLDPTGPIALSKSINRAIGRRDDHKHKLGMNRCKYNYYLYRFEYGPYQNIYDRDEKIISKKYSFINYIYQKLSKNNYTKLWKKRNIYL